MFKKLALLFTATLALVTGASAQNWQLVWQDTFDNGTIGPDWVFETGAGGWGNNELQYYRQENATVENGALVITAKNESFGGAAYTSARMKTQGRASWKYGKIEARIAMPSFQGCWPAFWMLGDSISSIGWPACGEIDIMEHVNTGNTTYGAVHWTAPNGSQADYTGNTTANSAITNYHTYTVEWTPTAIKWFVDGVQFNVIDITNGTGGTSEFHEKFFILLNLAIGGNWPGNTVNTGAMPAKMYVDYVKVYQDNGIAANQAYFMLVSKATGKCVDLISGNTANGAVINQWAYDYNGPNQRWALVPTEGSNHFKLISLVSGKCACPINDSTADGAQIHAWDYVGNNAAQQWDLVDAGNGWYKIRNVNSGKVLDLDAGSTANGAKLQQWTDLGGNNQLWRLQPWGDYFIKAASGRYVCVENSGSTNGFRIIQYDGQNNPWFKWRFESVGEGNYKVSSLNALSRVLCVKDGSFAQSYDCHLWDYNTANVGDQKVRIRPLTNGKYKFNFVHTNFTWDIPGGNTANNTPLQQYPDNGNVWQQFNLERVP
jgi:beta-glucanase (GH16 family)